jgi:hypothetical protein
MKLIFVKNLKSNFICNYIFNCLLTSNYKNNTLSFIKDFKFLFGKLNEPMIDVTNNINVQITKYKEDYRNYEKNVENELILICLQNSGDLIMRQKLNFITYARPI